MQLIQMLDAPYRPAEANPDAFGPAPVERDAGTIQVAAGTYEIGALDRGFAYDNERPRHTVELPAFEIDRTPVTNAAYLEYMGETGAEPPMYWERDGDGWVRTAMGLRRPSIRPNRSSTSPGTRPTPSPAGPASACRPSSSGRRRGPSSTASAAPGSGPRRTSSPTPASPPSPTRSTRRSSSATSYKVLRGASWTTHPHVARPSFRNWDLPQRRQIFAGIRLASDPEGNP